jgi:hypothetical protein
VRVERLQEISEADAVREGTRDGSDWEAHIGPDRDYSLCPDCGGEGLHGALGPSLGYTEVDCTTCDTFRKRFAILWDSINASPKPVIDPDTRKVSHYVSYPWADARETRTYRGKPWYVVGNPRVWVVEFRKVTP